MDQAKHLIERSWLKRLERLDDSAEQINLRLKEIEKEKQHYLRLNERQQKINVDLSKRVESFEQIIAKSL